MQSGSMSIFRYFGNMKHNFFVYIMYIAIASFSIGF